MTDMKRQMMVPVPVAGDSDDDSLTDKSAEAALQREVAELGAWLEAQGVDLGGDHAHADGRDRLYWHYGYLVGLKYGLAMLTNPGGTVH